MKLAYAIPWASPFIFSETVDSLLNLAKPLDYETRFFRGQGWCSAGRHNDICKRSLAWGADLICILGPDQVYPEDLLPRLVQRIKEGADVISAYVPVRGICEGQDMLPFERMAWKVVEGKLGQVRPAGESVQRIDVIGSGVLMFKADALPRLKKPWFSEIIKDEDYTRRPNDDTRFVWRLSHDLGLGVYVDPTIKVKHLNIFQIDETYSDRFKDWPGVQAEKIELKVREECNELKV